MCTKHGTVSDIRLGRCEQFLCRLREGLPPPPDLHGKPVICLSNNDCCVIARSTEAKQLGIRMDTPWFQLKDARFSEKLYVFSSNYALYASLSNLVASEKLMTPTQDTRDIIAAAVKAPDRIWVNDHRYAKAGCMLNDFTPTDVSQLNLFDDIQPRSNSNQLMKVVDGINHSGLGKCGLQEGE